MDPKFLAIFFTLQIVCHGFKTLPNCLNHGSKCVCDDSEGFLYFVCNEFFEMSIIENQLLINCNNKVIKNDDVPIEIMEGVNSIDFQNCYITTKIHEIIDTTKALDTVSIIILKDQLSMDQNIFENFSSLRNLNFKSNGYLEQLPVISKMHNIEGLDWNVKSKQSLSEDLFQNLQNVSRLSFVADIKKLENSSIHIKDMPKLQYLKYKITRFENISLEFNTLTELDLSGNKIESIPRIVFQNRNTLTTLILSQNRISTVDAKIFEGFGNLKELDLSYNSIINLEKLDIPSLKSLNLEMNKLGFIFKDMFSSLNLTKLNLDGNPVENNPPNFFKNSTFLKELQINLIDRFISDQMLNGLNHLGKLTVRFVINSEDDLILNSNSNVYENSLKLFSQSLFDNFTEINYLNLFFEHFFYFSRFTFIPESAFQYLKNLKILKLSSLKLSTVSENLLRHQEQLLEIDLSENAFMSALPENIFKYCPNLLKINLKYSYIESLYRNQFAFQDQVLEIDLSGNDFTNLPENIFRNNTKLQKLILMDTRLVQLSEITFKPLVNLVILWLNNNKLKRFDGKICKALPNIRTLDLGSNDLKDFHFQSCLEALQQKKRSALEIHKSFAIDKSVTINYPTISNLRKLSLNLNINLFENLNSFKINELNTLFEAEIYRRPTELSIYNNPFKCYCEMHDLATFLKSKKTFKGLSFLKMGEKHFDCIEPWKKLVTQYSEKEFISKLNLTDCPEKCVCSRRCLEDIQVTDCSALYMKEFPRIPSLVEGVSGLELIIELNNISEIVFDSRKDSITRIFASNNSIEKIPTEGLPKNLEILDIRNNNLTKLDPQTLNTFRQQKTLLYLSGNSWICDCVDKVLTKFLITYPEDVEFVNCWFDGKLYSINSEILLCKFDFIPYVIGSLILLLMVILIVSCFVIFKLEIKVWLFAHNLCLFWVTEEDLDKDKQFDAFICYSDKDEEYVLNIMDTLESGSHPYKLCLHFRDWKAGEYIPHQITNSVNQSRRIIFILTPNFMKSVWAKLEFRTANLASMKEKRARVIIILCDSIESLGELDYELKAYIRTNTYLKWGERWFWDKLRYALPHKAIEDVEREDRDDIELQTF
ncbi:Tl.2 family protein [Megaselia abdita]